MLAHTNFLSQEIQSDILAVEHDLHGLLCGRIGQADASAQFKAHRVLQVSQEIIGMSEQAVVAVTVHSHERKLLVELDTERFLVKSSPREVAPPLDEHPQRLLR